MYQHQKIIATICVRGGSKGVPGKNIKLLANLPLLAYTIKQARSSTLIDEIVLSTDSQEIKLIAEEYGVKVPFLRPAALATNQAGRVAAVIHAVQTVEKKSQQKFDVVVDLGNVTPLRQPQDIDNCIKKLVDSPKTNIVVSVTQPHRNPYFNMLEIDEHGFANLVKISSKPLLRRQDAPEVYDMNDAVFAIWKKVLYQEKSFNIPQRRVFVMPKERSIDIDTPFDFELVEWIMSKQK